MQKDGYIVLADAPDTEHLKNVQKHVSNAIYKKEAKNSMDKDLTILANPLDVEHAMKTNNLQSNVILTIFIH